MRIVFGELPIRELAPGTEVMRKRAFRTTVPYGDWTEVCRITCHDAIYEKDVSHFHLCTAGVYIKREDILEYWWWITDNNEEPDCFGSRSTVGTGIESTLEDAQRAALHWAHTNTNASVAH